jgi:Flp pilus assembly pilin Flp
VWTGDWIDRLRAFRRDTSANALGEYALFIAFLSIAVAAAITLLGGTVSGLLSNLATSLSVGS